MVKSLILAATALSLSSAVALAQNGTLTPGNDGVRAPAKMRHVAHHQKAMAVKPVYDYAPASVISYTTMPLILGVAY
jgi:hypothetical protein